jgi:hypothetical protein
MIASQPPRVYPFVWIALAAFLAVLPMLLMGNVWGHDFDFHTSMWMDAEEQLRQGILLPRWAAGANAGFGEPSLILYPPLSWMTGGLLGLILPWKFAAGAYVFLSLALSGWAMWKLAGDWLPPRDALFASLIYALNPYVMVMIYKRCAYGELLAGALFPLLLRGAIRIKTGFPAIPGLAAVFAAIWLADLPAGMVASYSLALMLAVESLLNRSWKPALYGAIAIVAAFAGLAFFLLPAAWERQWVEIGLVFRSDWIPENNFLFTSRNSNAIMALLNRGTSYLALLMMVATVAAAIYTRELRRRFPQFWYLLAAVGAATAFLMVSPSWILWQLLPALRYIEYPSRWLNPFSMVAAILVAAAVAESGRRRLLWAIAAVGLGALGGAMLLTVRWDTGNRHINQMASAANSGRGYRFSEEKDWRLPLGSHPAKLPDAAPLVAPVGDAQGIHLDIQQWNPERKVFSVASDRPTLLKIKLLNYPAWQATENGSAAPLQTDPATGQMLLSAPAGATRAEIVFTRTWDRTAGMAISFAALLIVSLLIRRNRRKTTDVGPSTGGPRNFEPLG